MIVAVPTNTEKIEGLIKATAILEENVVTLRRDLDQIKGASDKVESRIHEVDKQLSRIEESLKHTDQELDKLRAGRFEIGKLILAAILGGAVAFGFNLLTEIIKTMRVESQVQNPRQ
jgi:chromosome segregation ATPase